jgi:hypothetical protein
MAVRCAPPSVGVYTPDALPDRASFPYVGQLLIHRCGTLDCHGSAYRNLRIYGNEGLRLASSDRPLLPACTTPAEFDQDYESVVGLEPAIMSAVVADRGADPERLTFLRKPMGLESHKGLTLIQRGDEQYTCITSWLAGETDASACLAAIPSTPCLADGGVPSDASVE